MVTILVLITFILMIFVWVFLNFKVEQIFYDDFKEGIERSYNKLTDDLIIDDKTTTKDELSTILSGNPIISGLIIGEDKSYTIIQKGTEEIISSSDPFYTSNQTQFRNEIFKSENLLSVLPINSNRDFGQKQGYTRSKIGDFYDYVLTQKLVDGDYIVFFKYGREKASKVIINFNSAIFVGTFLSICAAFFIGYVLSRTITRPITDIMYKAEKITDGEFGQVLDIKSNDEIGKLAKTFNFMSSRLKETVTEISKEKNKVETILNCMTEGVIAFNIDGDVIHANPSSKKILGRRNIDLHFDEFVKLFEIDLSKEQIFEEQTAGQSNHKVQFNDKYLRLQFASFTDEKDRIEGIIAVIQDITEEEKLDIMRREFVANVSHELRTPLTSVKSYTETLLDGAMEDQPTTEHFLKVINDETDRMTRLVRDLLVLSQHDSGIKLNFEAISIVDLTASCVERMKREAVLKHQELKLNAKSGLPLIQGDRHRLDQLIVNIIGNAIKYTPERGRISVYVYQEKEKCIVCVEDNGIGIPENDIGRIFERFYRVDKARSRQMGGTGLGLAIAREIAVLHGGNIYAKSKLGKGTQIHIELPINRRS